MEKIETQKNFFENSPIKDVYVLLQIDNETDKSNPMYLSEKYSEEDQKLMKSESWDYNNSNLIINKVKSILEKVNVESLSEQEKEWHNEIFWFWYHHAISCAIGRYKDIEKAKYYAAEAMNYQSKSEGGHPNQITKLLYLLVNDKLEEAEQFDKIAKYGDEDEKQSGKELIENYKNGWKEY